MKTKKQTKLEEKIMNTVYGSIMTPSQTRLNETTKPNKEKEQNNLVSLQPLQQTKKNVHCCPDCSIEMGYSNIQGAVCYLCDGCGRIEEIIGDNSEFDEFSSALLTGYSVNTSSIVPMKMVGPQSSTYQRRVISGTAEYKNVQRKVTFDEMTKLNCQVDAIKVPPHIVSEAARDYCKLQQHYIRRGDVRRGIMGWLVYELCKKSGIDRTPGEISDMFLIPSDELSNGSKVVKQARVDGILDDIGNNGYDPTGDMERKLKRYFGIFDISETYISFAQTVIEFVVKKRKRAVHSGMKSRCTGTIYILGLALDLEISKQKISDKCEISIATFTKFISYIREIMNAGDTNTKKLKHIFNKHNVPIIDF